MALSKEIWTPMLSAQFGFIKELEDKGYEGEELKKMKELADQIEQKAGQCDDIASFFPLINDEMMQISTFYSEAMVKADQPQAGTSSEENETNEASKTSPDSVQKSFDMHIETIRKDLEEAKNDPERQHEIPLYERKIEIYESGATWPKYLMLCDKEMIDQKFLTNNRSMYEEYYNNSVEDYHLKHIKLAEELLEEYDRISAKSPTGVPDPVEWEARDYLIRHKHQPHINEYDLMTTRWAIMLQNIHDWLDSYSMFAPGDQRWTMDSPDLKIIYENIMRTRSLNPGVFNVWDEIITEYFGLPFIEIFDHEYFKWETKAAREGGKWLRMEFSDDRIEVFKNLRPYVKPFNEPPSEFVHFTEEKYAIKKKLTQEQIDNMRSSLKNFIANKGAYGPSQEKGIFDLFNI